MKKLFTVSIEDESKVDHFVKGFIEGKQFPIMKANPKFDPKKKDSKSNSREIDSGVTELEFMKDWVIKVLKAESSNGHAAIKSRLQVKNVENISII